MIPLTTQATVMGALTIQNLLQHLAHLTLNTPIREVVVIISTLHRRNGGSEKSLNPSQDFSPGLFDSMAHLYSLKFP